MKNRARDMRMVVCITTALGPLSDPSFNLGILINPTSKRLPRYQQQAEEVRQTRRVGSTSVSFRPASDTHSLTHCLLQQAH